jgi:hypothetical protein
MSRSDAQFPGLGELAKANGVNYITALQRAKRGWPVEYAGSVPAGQSCPAGFVKKKPGPAPKPKVPRVVLEHVQYMWDRPGWKASARRDRFTAGVTNFSASAIIEPKKKLIHKRAANAAYDTSPARIRKIRAALCDGFIKTGVLDEGLTAQLRNYADECRATEKHPDRVPDEHATNLRSREAPSTGNHGRGVDHQADAGAVERIADFLRSQ